MRTVTKIFTCNAHICTKKQYARPTLGEHSTEILLNRSQDILRPKVWFSYILLSPPVCLYHVIMNHKYTINKRLSYSYKDYVG